MVIMLSPSKAKDKLWVLPLPLTKVYSSLTPCNACCPQASHWGSTQQRQTSSGLSYCSESHTSCCYMWGSFPAAFPCISFAQLARPLERLSRPLLPQENLAFLPTQVLWPSDFYFFLYSRKLIFFFLLDKKKKRGRIFPWLCFSPSSCICHGHRQIKYFQL